jgi:RHS repeat-associated protein
MLIMAHLSSIEWDYKDQLHSAGNNSFISYYNYDAQGSRTRKVVEKGNIIETRYYINGYELYKKENNETIDIERTTLNIADNEKVFVNVEIKTRESPVVKYQYDNHLGSACLELDENGEIISYEEYHPFGTTSYRSGTNETEVSLTRYKYCGKERDEETGLYYYGMRYYVAWLCRFVSVDPLQFKYPHYTPYQYAGNKPISFIDLDGGEEKKTQKELNPENKSFFTEVSTYLESEIKNYKIKLVALESQYKAKEWKIDKTTGNFKVYQDRIDTLIKAKNDFKTMENIAKELGGDNLLTLANVIYNEAASSNEQAKQAVAYAYLNRIGYNQDSEIREPKGAEISHYSRLKNRWTSFNNQDKLTFAKEFKKSFDAAVKRLKDNNPSQNDPTQGSTHWVSPKGLTLGKSTDTYYNTEFKKYFPNWARNQQWVKNNPKDAAKWFDVKKFKEVTVKGVQRNDFIFYRGVR